MRTVDQIIEDNGYDLDDCEIVVFRDPDYTTALIGVSEDNRAVYNYNKMIEYLVSKIWTKKKLQTLSVIIRCVVFLIYLATNQLFYTHFMILKNKLVHCQVHKNRRRYFIYA